MSQSQLPNWFNSKSQLMKLPDSPLESAREILRASDQTVALRATNKVKVYHLLSSTLDFSPEQEGQDWFAGVILASGGIQDNLNQIAEDLFVELFIPLVTMGRTPSVSMSSSTRLVPEREDGDDREESAGQTALRELKHKLLRRDGFKCCFTGMMDLDSYLAYLVHGDGEGTPLFVLTDPGQILPFRPINNEGTNFQQYAATWEILGKWAPSSKMYTANHEEINPEGNAMTMDNLQRTQFGRFNVTLKTTNIQHRYEPIGWGRAISLFRGIEEITFENHDKTATHDLPDPKLIAIHYAITNILHASEAIDVINQALKEEEEVSLKESDASGSTDIPPVTTARLLTKLGLPSGELWPALERSPCSQSALESSESRESAPEQVPILLMTLSLEDADSTVDG